MKTFPVALPRARLDIIRFQFCGEKAASCGLKYFWVDTCCIDKSNSTELQHAITSMFRWYRNAARCYVYLSDVSTTGNDLNSQFPQFPWESAFRKSRWFTRGWTLQELLAPGSVEFFSKDGSRLGDKRALVQQIHEVTGIAILALRGTPLSEFSVEERLSWVEQRQTTVEEDRAYCLLGIFNVYLPLIYGEGDNAFSRLKEEIEKSSRRHVFSKLRANNQCFKCGSRNHWQSNCDADPEDVQDFRRHYELCLICGSDEHWVRGCPRRRYLLSMVT